MKSFGVFYHRPFWVQVIQGPGFQVLACWLLPKVIKRRGTLKEGPQSTETIHHKSLKTRSCKRHKIPQAKDM